MTKNKVGKASNTYLKRELDRAYQLIAILRTQLMKEDIDSFNNPPEWSKPLTMQETQLMAMLLKHHPCGITKFYIEENLPKLDHVKERRGKIADVVVSKTRAILGKSTIETVRDQGFRCSDEFASKYKHTIK